MLQYADPRTPFPYPASQNVDGLDATDMRTDWVPRRQFKCSILFAYLLESAHSLFCHSARGGVFGNRCGAASLRAPDSHITNVCL